MKKKWNFEVTELDREKYMNELIATGRAGPDLDDTDDSINVTKRINIANGCHYRYYSFHLHK